MSKRSADPCRPIGLHVGKSCRLKSRGASGAITLRMPLREAAGVMACRVNATLELELLRRTEIVDQRGDAFEGIYRVRQQLA